MVSGSLVTVYLSKARRSKSMDEQIRSEHIRHVVSNSWISSETEVGRQDKAHFLNEHDGISSHITENQVALSCGCVADATVGGVCSQCFGAVCRNCLRRCWCGAPLGPCHAQMSFDARGNVIHSCPACYAALKRRQALRTLLSPFVRFRE